MFQQFTWNGEPITDIRAWAKERREKLVEYRAVRMIPSMISNSFEIEEKTGHMPSSFWNNLVWSHGWRYSWLGEEEP